MTVKDLISRLQRYPDDMEVAIATPVHDYGGTVLAMSVRNTEIEPVKYSSYYGSNVIERTSDTANEVLVLK